MSPKPTDLVFVHDVYGRRHRVRQTHLDDTRRILLPRFNQFGYRVTTDWWLLHRENIATGD